MLSKRQVMAAMAGLVAGGIYLSNLIHTEFSSIKGPDPAENEANIKRKLDNLNNRIQFQDLYNNIERSQMH